MSDEQNFNDAELQDIMNEIENLEREYEEEDSSSSASKSEETSLELTDADLAELSELDGELSSVEEEQVEEEDFEGSQEQPQEAEIVEMRPEAQAVGTSGAGPMNFSGKGQMDFEMNFQIGSSQAHLQVQQDQGLHIKMDGVALHIDESGCQVKMKGGVQFSVPFDESKKAG